MKILKMNNVEELLVPQGTKIMYGDDWTDEEMIGIVDGNDLDSMDEDDDFEDINYYIIPLEHIDDEAPSNHYVMLLREDFEIIEEE